MAHDPLRQAYGQRRHLNNIYTTVCATIATLEHQARILRSFAEKTLADMAEIEARYGLKPIQSPTNGIRVTLAAGNEVSITDFEGATAVEVFVDSDETREIET